MEKTVTIDGKKVRFKSTGATALRYKAQFKKDYFSEILKLNQLSKLKVDKNSQLDLDNVELDNVDFEVFFNITWSLAKTADNSIPDPLTWLDGFDVFPILDIIPELTDMIVESIQAKKK
ncbi:hypothetical protein P9E76_15475 [Schinkia azotoformans]|uniref:Prophage pi2 protein 40 n=1 Tax=Schinkia azotoformans LMG 9581 TaxID=1131731 RepID=K6DJ01_SCHAZ|nr:hypothetical protein [Schinkia azotoformans]EKN68073.1 prophage pi2 protein 40 [Schinkia azotoformans LMG 9581]MEC1638121.1 hypothetical protein [Schinkia azotoformans]MEC1946445.1 hypothetical protein [Schinkia azotoformans]